MSQRKTRARKRRARKVGRRPPVRTYRKHPATKGTHISALLVLVMFLYMLRLIDEKTMRRIKRDLAPKKKRSTSRRRRRKQTT